MNNVPSTISGEHRLEFTYLRLLIQSLITASITMNFDCTQLYL